MPYMVCYFGVWVILSLKFFFITTFYFFFKILLANVFIFFGFFIEHITLCFLFFNDSYINFFFNNFIKSLYINISLNYSHILTIGFVLLILFFLFFIYNNIFNMFIVINNLMSICFNYIKKFFFNIFNKIISFITYFK